MRRLEQTPKKEFTRVQALEYAARASPLIGLPHFTDRKLSTNAEITMASERNGDHPRAKRSITHPSSPVPPKPSRPSAPQIPVRRKSPDEAAIDMARVLRAGVRELRFIEALNGPLIRSEHALLLKCYLSVIDVVNNYTEENIWRDDSIVAQGRDDEASTSHANSDYLCRLQERYGTPEHTFGCLVLGLKQSITFLEGHEYDVGLLTFTKIERDFRAGAELLKALCHKSRLHSFDRSNDKDLMWLERSIGDELREDLRSIQSTKRWRLQPWVLDEDYFEDFH